MQSVETTPVPSTESMHATNLDCSAVETSPSLSIVGRLLVTRHPLETPWCLYYFIQDYVKEKWMECMLPVATVRTLEEFFRCARATTPPHTAPLHSMKMSLKTIAAIEPNARNSIMGQLRREFYFFREGIQPEWEDVHNAEGGRWSAQVCVRVCVSVRMLSRLTWISRGTCGRRWRWANNWVPNCTLLAWLTGSV